MVSSTDSHTYELISSSYEDSLAVEMEGWGFLRAVRMTPGVEAIVIRGVSDPVDNKDKADKAGWQPIAARHAAAFAFELLAQFDAETREQKDPKKLAIWNVPFGRNRNFTGRASLLLRLRKALTSGQTAAITQVSAIHGLGGVGKTELAVEYAYKHKGDYDVVWWVRSEDSAGLAADYALLANALDLPEKEERDQNVVIAAVKRWLVQNGGWLLILDNVSHPNDVVQYVPEGAPGHVVITSRDPNWEELAVPLEVDVWPENEASRFLMKRTGRRGKVGAARLARALGCFPLALEQAAAYIAACHVSFDHYVGLLKERGLELLESVPASERYKKTVATTWEISFKDVKVESATAADLLNLCAFLFADDIPKGLLQAHEEFLPKRLAPVASDAVKLDNAVAVLRRYSLVGVGDHTLSVHRLVQEVARERLRTQTKRKWAEVAANLVNAAFPYDSNDVGTWPTCAVLLPHAQAVAGHAEELGVALDSAGRLLNQVGVYLKWRAQFTAARAHFERALRIDEAVYGSDHPEVATDVNNLGGVLQDLGDLAGARAHFERALRIDEAAYGPDHPEVATLVNNLGLVLQDLGDLAGARAHLERALRIDEAAYGPDHPEVARDVNNLGLVLQDLGDLAGARAHFERALRIDEAVYGPEHPTVATKVNNLGGVLQDLGDLAGGRAHFERALRIDEAAYGADHPDVATDVNSLGSVLQDLGDLAGARAHYERALAIYRKFFDDDHPDTKLVRESIEYLDSLEKSDA